MFNMFKRRKNKRLHKEVYNEIVLTLGKYSRLMIYELEHRVLTFNVIFHRSDEFSDKDLKEYRSKISKTLTQFGPLEYMNGLYVAIENINKIRSDFTREVYEIGQRHNVHLSVIECVLVNLYPNFFLHTDQLLEMLSSFNNKWFTTYSVYQRNEIKNSSIQGVEFLNTHYLPSFEARSEFQDDAFKVGDTVLTRHIGNGLIYNLHCKKETSPCEFLATIMFAVDNIVVK